MEVVRKLLQYEEVMQNQLLRFDAIEEATKFNFNIQKKDHFDFKLLFKTKNYCVTNHVS